MIIGSYISYKGAALINNNDIDNNNNRDSGVDK